MIPSEKCSTQRSTYGNEHPAAGPWWDSSDADKWLESVALEWAEEIDSKLLYDEDDESHPFYGEFTKVE